MYMGYSVRDGIRPDELPAGPLLHNYVVLAIVRPALQ